MKSGSTSIQLNILLNKKFAKHLKADNFQIISKFNYIELFKLIWNCFDKEDPNERDCIKWKELKTFLDKAYNDSIASSSSKPIHTIYSSETWSNFPNSNFTFSLLVDLFSKWDLHVIIFYR